MSRKGQPETTGTIRPPGLDSRLRAHAVLHMVLDRRLPLETALDKGRPQLSTRDSAFVRNLVSTTLRRLGQIDSLMNSCLDRPLPRTGTAARNALRLGICQLWFLDTPAHAAVATSVALARRGPDKFVGLVNAVLRRISREPIDRVQSRFPDDLNLPAWLRESWVATYGKEGTRRIAAAHLETPPLDLTVRRDAAGWAAKLGGIRIGETTVRLRGAGEVSALPGYSDGEWWVQDAAAALPARVVAASTRLGARVCDLCAAPGGKTLQLAAKGFEVEAVDISAKRLALLRDNLERLKMGALVVQADATNWQPGKAFDAVLLDVPCSATGTIRRHPDIPILKNRTEVLRLAGLQTRLLNAALSLVDSGCPVIYSVCSLEQEECGGVIDSVLSERNDVVREPVTRREVAGLPIKITETGDVRTLPCDLEHQGGMDGFFVSRLRRL